VKHRSRTATLAALAALLMLPIAARADIAPMPRPSAAAGGSTAATGGSATPPAGVSPVVKPVVRPAQAPVQPAAQGAAVTKAPVAQTTVQTPPVAPTTVVHPSAPTTTVVVRAPEPAASSGGRAEAPVPVTTTGGHADEEPVATPLPTPPARKLVPTKLVAVGHEPVPTYDAWPSWVLALLTVLISAEAFLVVRLSRSRPRNRAPQGISV
jgi:hypothetical protein